MDRQGSVNYLVSLDGQRIAEFASFDRTPCVVDGVEYRFAREKGDRFWLEGPVGVLGVANRVDRTDILVSAAPHELLVRRGGRRFAPRWELHADGQVHGGGHAKLTRGAWDLPEHLPLPLRVFLLYVMVSQSLAKGAGLALGT